MAIRHETYQAQTSYYMTLGTPPFDPNTMFQQASLLVRSGRLAEAAAAYQELLVLFPTHSQLLTGLGRIEFQLGNLETCIGLFRQSLKVEPAQPVTLSDLAICLAKVNRLDEALACYEKAIALKPDYAEAYNNWFYPDSTDTQLRAG